MAARLLSMPGAIWAHNGGAFDFKWLLDWMTVFDCEAQVIATGGRVISIRCGQTRFFDSMALAKISLEDFTSGLSIAKQKLDLPCICKLDCGGYCSIKRDMAPAHLARMLEYQKADCESLYLALQALREFAAGADLDLGATVGGSAFRNAARLLGLPKPTLGKMDFKFARRAAYGGRTQLFIPYCAEGYETDVNSMYPSRLGYHPVPVGTYEKLYDSDAHRAFLDARPGIYRARVNVPQMHMPPLPVHVDGRNAYPYGEFEGVWALPELQYAQALGVNVSVFEGLAWEREDVMFRPWVERTYNMRFSAPGGKKGPLGTFMKFYLNSVGGKLGSRADHEKYDFNIEDIIKHHPRNEAEKKAGIKCQEECKGDCGCHFAVPGLPIHKRHVWHIDDCSHVEWFAYMTARSRVEWHRQATSRNEGRDVAYGDTDGMFTKQKRPCTCGNDSCPRTAVGHWEDTGPYRDFKGVAPKVYTFTRPEKGLQVRAKGLPLRLPKKDDPKRELKLQNLAAAIHTGQVVSRVQPLGFKLAGRVAGKFFHAAEQKRQVQVGYGDRVFDEKLGYTVPQHISAFRLEDSR